MQNLAWVTSLVAMTAVAAIFVWVAVGASKPAADAASIGPRG